MLRLRMSRTLKQRKRSGKAGGTCFSAEAMLALHVGENGFASAAQKKEAL
jgi:hypothetical protein